MPDAPMTYDAAAISMREAGQRIRAVEEAHKIAVSDAADAEALYRKTLGDKFEANRSDGKGVEESLMLARRDTWNLLREREKATGMVRYQLERLEDRRGERASVHKLVEWSGAMAVLNGKTRQGDSNDDPR
jgi:hypothetical protein